MEQLAFLEAPLLNYVIPIIFFFFTAYLFHRAAPTLATQLRPHHKYSRHTHERIQTMQALIASIIRLASYITAFLLSLSRFIDADTLIWIVGLFSAAFGLGARPFISDYLTGIMLLFDGTYDVGDKVEFPMHPRTVEGVVEQVSLRTTKVRSMDGELFTMPNGDIRLIRNFTRGSFSSASVVLTIPADKFTSTLDHLETLQGDAMERLPNLLEPWKVISTTGELGANATLTIVAKAKFGKGAELRTRLLAWLQEEISHIEVNMPQHHETLPKIENARRDNDL